MSYEIISGVANFQMVKMFPIIRKVRTPLINEFRFSWEGQIRLSRHYPSPSFSQELKNIPSYVPILFLYGQNNTGIFHNYYNFKEMILFEILLRYR